MTVDELIERIRPLATITLTAEPEVEGNASAWNDGTDESYWQSIREDLDAGNEWAWCCAHVCATLGSFQGDDYLGACSYKSREDFMQPDGYYPQMVDEALADLARSLLAARTALAEVGLCS